LRSTAACVPRRRVEDAPTDSVGALVREIEDCEEIADAVVLVLASVAVECCLDGSVCEEEEAWGWDTGGSPRKSVAAE
jgi:hypothetical protein